MDITPTFKQCLQSVKQSNKAIKEILNDTTKEDKKSVLRRKQLSDFNRDAKGLVNSITDLKNHLLHNRKDYINI